MASLNFPQDYLQMNDIYLWGSSFERETEYQSELHADRTSVLSRQSVEVETFDAESADHKNVKLIRAQVTLGVRIVFIENEGAEPVHLHTLEATFAAEYLVLREFKREHFEEFCNFNCVHNVWPFWRQHVYETLKNASLPVIAVPFFPGKPSGRKKARKKIVSAKQISDARVSQDD